MYGSGGEWIRGLGLALPILCEQGECMTCVCVLVMWIVAWISVCKGGVMSM